MLAFSIVARIEPDAQIAAAFGAIPFMLGLGFFPDAALIRRDAKVSYSRPPAARVAVTVGKSNPRLDSNRGEPRGDFDVRELKSTSRRSGT